MDFNFKWNRSFWDFLVRTIIWAIVIFITFGIGTIWVLYDSTKWFIEGLELKRQAYRPPKK